MTISHTWVDITRGKMIYVLSAYLHNELPGVTVFMSDALTTYDAGPIPELCMTLAEISVVVLALLAVFVRSWQASCRQSQGGQVELSCAVESSDGLYQMPCWSLTRWQQWKSGFLLKKVCYKVCLCENFQWQSSQAFTGLSNHAQMVGGGHPLKCKFCS